MTRVRVLVSIAGVPSFTMGEVVELADDVAAAWMAGGYVELWDGPAPIPVAYPVVRTVRPLARHRAVREDDDMGALVG